MLTYASTVIFIELKQRKTKNNDWIKEAEEQLEATIEAFKQTDLSPQFTSKQAYICNSKKPQFRRGQTERMEKFYDRTGYVLHIVAVIKLNSPKAH